MAVYHFFWEGKERTVSVNQIENAVISLTFIDEEIQKKVHSNLLIKKAGSQLLYLNENEIASLAEANRLVASIEQGIGRPFAGSAQPVV